MNAAPPPTAFSIPAARRNSVMVNQSAELLPQAADRQMICVLPALLGWRRPPHQKPVSSRWNPWCRAGLSIQAALVCVHAEGILRISWDDVAADAEAVIRFTDDRKSALRPALKGTTAPDCKSRAHRTRSRAPCSVCCTPTMASGDSPTYRPTNTYRNTMSTQIMQRNNENCSQWGLWDYVLIKSTRPRRAEAQIHAALSLNFISFVLPEQFVF